MSVSVCKNDLIAKKWIFWPPRQFLVTPKTSDLMFSSIDVTISVASLPPLRGDVISEWSSLISFLFYTFFACSVSNLIIGFVCVWVWCLTSVTNITSTTFLHLVWAFHLTWPRVRWWWWKPLDFFEIYFPKRFSEYINKIQKMYKPHAARRMPRAARRTPPPHSARRSLIRPGIQAERGIGREERIN